MTIPLVGSGPLRGLGADAPAQAPVRDRSPRRPAARPPAASPPQASAAQPPAPLDPHNIILATDGYKLSHHRQYPPKTEVVSAYFESRAGARFERTTFFGLQYYLDTYLCRPVTQAHVDEAEALAAAYIGPGIFNRAGWQHIVDHHGGRLPLSIRAVPEGTAVPAGHVLMTVENTDPACFWLTNYVETLLTHVWYPSTVASQSRHMRGRIAHYLEATGGNPAEVDLKLHDFGFRGVSSLQSAGMGAAAHLLSFRGTDTLEGIRLLRNHYAADVAGVSVPAAEHSTITSWTRTGELDAYRNMLDAYPRGTVAVVSDSYDIEHACRHLWGERLRARVLARDGITVIRPDSGEPAASVLRVHEILGEAFGTTVNARGYRQLNPKVAVLQGDGIDVDSIEPLLAHLQAHGWCTQSLTLGSGGGLLQKLHRDTQKFAFKASAARVDGAWRDVYKDPAGDAGKRSKRGRLKLARDPEGNYHTLRRDAQPQWPDLLQEVYRDGEVRLRHSLAEVRARVAEG